MHETAGESETTYASRTRRGDRRSSRHISVHSVFTIVVKIAVTVALIATLASTAHASPDSERLYSRGLVEMNGGRPAAALVLFDRAVDADAGDAYARYYRGLTRRQLRDLDGAIDDFRAALSIKPTLDPAALELGRTLVENEEYAAAVPLLEQASRVPQLAPEASLYLGLAQLRLGSVEEARQNFERAAAYPSTQTTARYYLGLTAYRSGQWADAQRHFTYVAEAVPETEMGREAAAFLASVGEGQTGARYRVYGQFGLEYDSNVLLAPSDDATKQALLISNQDDGSGLILVGGSWVPWRNSWARLSLGYEFFQRLYFDLTEFNLQDHRPAVEVVANVGPVQLGLLGQYDYYLLETDSFLQDFVALPWVTVPLGNVGRTEVFYRMLRNVFYKQPFKDLNTAFNHAAGLRQFFYLGAPDRYVWAGYTYDHEDTDHSDVFAYDGNAAGVGVGWTLPAAVKTEAGYTYTHASYDDASLGRRDNEHEFGFVVRWPVIRYLTLGATYLGTINDSNQDVFSYNRHRGALFVEVGL